MHSKETRRVHSRVSSCSLTTFLACLADDFHFSASVRESVIDLNKSFCVLSQSSVFSSMSQEDAVIESLVRNRADLGGDLCLDMGSGIITGIRVGVEGLGSLLGLGRKSATDALVFKNDKLDMAEDMSAMGSLHVSTGLEAARILRFESFSGLKGRGPPIFSGTCRTLMVVVEATGVVGSESGWFQMICLLSQIRKSHDDAALWRFPPATRTPLSSSYALQGIATTRATSIC
jgi:hypothetical protein